MSRRISSAEPEPITALFGDVVRDAPPLLYGLAPVEAPAPPPPAVPQPPAGAAPPPPPRPRPAPDPEWRPPPRSADVIWRDDNALLSGVVILHGLITVLTLGLYRFWMAAETRVVLWSHTTLEKEPLEWTGKGSEMFVGAMIALAFVGTMLGTANLAAAWFGLSGFDDPLAAVAAQTAAVAAIAAAPLWQYAVFRARRYRLSRTRWRSLRFGMQGSGLSLVGLFALWAPLLVLTAGLAFPFWRWARERHLTDRSFWGTERFRFEGGPWALAAHWAPLWGLVAAAAALAASPALREAAGLGAPEAMAAENPVSVALGALLGALCLGLLWLNYRAAEIRLFWNARRLAGARATCDFSIWHLVDAHLAVLWRNVWPGVGFYLLVSLITLVPIIAAGRAEMENPGAGELVEGLGAQVFDGLRSWRAQGLMLMALVVNYVMSAVFVMWLWSAIHAGRVHRHLCESLHVTGLETLDDVGQRPRDAGIEAEGFADALDVAGF